MKQTMLSMVVVLGIFLLWMTVLRPWLYRVNGWTDQPIPQQSSDTESITPSTSSSTQPGSTTGPANSLTTAPANFGRSVVGGTAGTATIGSVVYEPESAKVKSQYPLGISVTSRGAAIESVTLNRYKQQVGKLDPYVFQKPYDVGGSLAWALATRSITIDGGSPLPLDYLNWHIGDSATPQSVSYFVDVNGADQKPLLRLTKTFEIHPAGDKTAGYEMLVNYSLQNFTDQPIKARLAFNGTNVPKSENNRDLPEVVAGFDSGRQAVDLEHSPTGSIKGGSPLNVAGLNKEPLLWSGTTSAYFDAIVRPTNAAGAPFPFVAATATQLTPDAKNPAEQAVALGYDTGEITVPAAGSSSFGLNVYFGPKLRDILEAKYYSSYPLGYDQTLVLKVTSGIGAICGFCTFPSLINLLVWMLKGFHIVFRDWGLAIIGLVCLVRLILHPVTKRSQISMSRMTKMGPEMERLKKKYGDDTEGLKKAQMEFYKEQGVAPFLGCLPMFLQMPIWIALWSSLQSTFEIRHASFLWGYTWIKDLAQPDRLVPFRHPFDFFFIHMDAINLLPILMGIMFYIQQQFQPQPVAADPQQAQQQKMMKMMSIFLFPLFLYSSPSGLNLYIFTSTLIGIVESKRIRDHIKEKEDREKAGIVLIDAEPAKKSGGRSVKEEPVKPRTGWFANLQAKLEELQRQQAPKGKKRR